MNMTVWPGGIPGPADGLLTVDVMGLSTFTLDECQQLRKNSLLLCVRATSLVQSVLHNTICTVI